MGSAHLPPPVMIERTDSLALVTHAAEDSYRQTARNLDYGEAEVQEWVAAIMFRLRAEVAAQELTEQKNKRENDALSVAGTLCGLISAFGN